MCLKHIKIVFSRAPRRFKQFYSNVIAGLFSGTLVGIFFAIVAPTQFLGWSSGIEWLKAIGFTLFCLILLHQVGKKLFGDLGESSGFLLNYVAGFVSSLISSLLILYAKNFFIALSIIIGFILLFFVVSYCILRLRMPKKENALKSRYVQKKNAPSYNNARNKSGLNKLINILLILAIIFGSIGGIFYYTAQAKQDKFKQQSDDYLTKYVEQTDDLNRGVVNYCISPNQAGPPITFANRTDNHCGAITNLTEDYVNNCYHIAAYGVAISTEDIMTKIQSLKDSRPKLPDTSFSIYSYWILFSLSLICNIVALIISILKRENP